ncbi:MAG: EutN/CcmL family microcompartment protein [Deltaproteobacteria bacterium]|nr:EutN/CcmL family microcompartment protein [Deltaproteobacteria bacterium]
MLIGRVEGTVVASHKDPNLNGMKLHVVQQTDHLGNPKGSQVVAVDAVGAGVGELVLYASGSSARQTEVTQNKPVDAVIMAIVDEIEVQGKSTFVK